MSTYSKHNKAIVAVIFIVIILVGIGYYVNQQPTTTTSTSSSTSISGQAVPNPDTLVEERSVAPGPGGYDPALSWDDGANPIIENVYETLVTWDGPSALKYVPWLAESWDVSPDGLVYTFHLRQGIMFQDGTPFNATAVKFSLDRAVLINHADGPEFLISPNETMAIKGAPRYSNAETVHNYNASEAKIYLTAGGVKVLDLYTVQITLEHPYAAVIATIAFSVTGIVSPSYVIANCPGSAEMPGVMPGIECEFMINHGMGTGPWKLVEVSPKERVVLERFDGYWGGPNHTGPAKLRRYVVKYVPEVGTRELDLFSGTTDTIELRGPNAFDIIDKNAWLNNHQIVPLRPGIRVWTAPTIAVYSITLNPRIKPLDNVLFRQALSYAFDYDTYITQALNGFAVRLTSLVPPGMFGYDPTVPSYSYDPAKAKALFQQVGYTGTLEISVASGDTNSASAALLFKDSLSQLDPAIQIKISEVDTPTSLTLYHTFKLPIRLGLWTQDLPDPAECVANFATQAGFRAKMSQFNNDTITSLVNRAASITDPTERLAIYHEIQTEMYRKAPYIWLMTPIAINVERDWVLPADSPIGRGVYNPAYGDGTGGLSGGYHPYAVWKASITQQVAVDIGNMPIASSLSTHSALTSTIAPTVVADKGNSFAASSTVNRYNTGAAS